MATPIYQYPTRGAGASILEGAMSALSGGLIEIDETKKAQDQMNQFSEILAERGFVGDAKIYKTMADNQKPNFLQAAITGRTTKRDTQGMAEHALKILQDDRDNRTRLASARDQRAALDVSLAKQEISANNTSLNALNREKQRNAAILANPSGHHPDVIKAKVQEQSDIQTEIDRLNAENDAIRSQAQAAVNRSGRGGGYGDPTAPFSSDIQLPTTADPSAGAVSPLPNVGSGGSTLMPNGRVGSGVLSREVLEKNDADRAAMSDPSSIGYSTDVLTNAIRPKAPSVTEGSPEVLASEATWEARVRNARALRNIPDSVEIKTEDDLKMALQYGKPQPTDGPLSFDSNEEAIDYAKKSGLNFSLRQNPEGKIQLSLSNPRSSSDSNRTGLVVKMGPDIYTVDKNGVVHITTPDGVTMEFKDKDGQRITRTKLLGLIVTHDKFNPTDPAVFLGSAMTPREVNSIGTNPVVPAAPPAYNTPPTNTGSIYIPKGSVQDFLNRKKNATQ